MNIYNNIIHALKNPRKIFFSYILGINESYSQTGEDIIIKHHLGEVKKYGTFIDIGANTPIRLNNTYLFYQSGRRGINIEPNKKLIKRFGRYRRGDKNLNIAVGPAGESDHLKFFVFDAHTLSTTDEKTAKKYEAMGHKIIDTYEVPLVTLESIFEKYVQNNYVDILSVDVEGFDMEVLKSNDRNKYYAKYIILETVEYSKDNTGAKLNSMYDVYLGQYGYKKIADTYINTIYYKQ